MTHPDRRPQLDADHALREIAGIVGALAPVDGVAADGRDLARTGHPSQALPAVLDEEWWDEPEVEDVEQAARARLAPYVMAGVTGAVGVSAWGCAQVAGWMAGLDGAATVETVTWMASAVSVPLLRSMFRHRIPDGWRTRWWLSTAAAAAWVDVTVTRGPDLLTPDTATGMSVALILGTWLLGARWAAEHEVPNPGDEYEDEDIPESDPMPVVATPRRPEIDTSRAREIERDWIAEVSGGRNPIARGAELQQRTHLPHGYRWLVQLDRAEHVGAADLVSDNATARVAFKLGVRATHVIIERLEGDEDREDRVLLTVITRDVLAKGVTYEGPNYDRGIVDYGDRADGAGPALWTAYNEAGVVPGLVTGAPRSGKSTFLANLGMALRSSNEWIVLYGDCDEEGNSSSLLAATAHDFAKGPEAVLQQLEGLEAVKWVRGKMMGTFTTGPDGKPVPMRRGDRPVEKLLPCPHMPSIVWILDEFHAAATDPVLKAANFGGRFAKLARMLPKYGISFYIGTHSNLGGDYGGDSSLRAMLAQGNNVAFRNTNKSEQGITSDAGYNPGSLPKGGGYAFADEGAGRAMVRVAASDDMDAWLPQVLACGTWDRRSLAAYTRCRKVNELDPVAEYEARMADLATFDEAEASGAPLPGTPEYSTTVAVDARAPAAPDAPMSFGGFTIPTGASNVVPIRRDVEQAPPEPEPARLSDKALRVLAMLRTHPQPWTTAQLEHATGVSKPDVSKALGELVRAGLACRPTGKQGVYAATSISVQKESS